MSSFGTADVLNRFGCSFHPHSGLQEGFHVCARQNCFCLLEGLDFLITSSLTDVKVLEDEVTAGMQLAVVGRKLVQVGEDGFMLSPGLCEVVLSLALGFRLVDDVLACGLDAGVRLLDESFVCLLRTAL